MDAKGSSRVVTGLLAIAFLWLQMPGLGLLPGDEWIYLKGGQLLAHGVLPYQDYFLAHPPLRTVLACLIWLASGSVLATKALCLLATVGTAVALHVLSDRWVRPGAGPLAVALFLFSQTTLTTAPFFVGINLALFLAVAGLLCLEFECPLWAGLFHSFALTAALYAALPVAVAVVVVVLFRRRWMPRYALGLTAFLVVFALCCWAFGMGFVEQVFLYHFKKSGDMPGFESSGSVFAGFLEYSYLVVILPLLGAPIWGRTPRLAVAAVSGLVLTATVALYPSAHSYYFLLGLPFLAVGGAGAVLEFARLLRAKLSGKISAMVLVVLAFGTSFYFYDTLSRHINVRNIWTKVSAESASLAAVVSDSGADCVLFGDSSAVPMVSAILYPEVECSIAGDILDTNPKRLYTGLVSPQGIIEQADSGGANRLLFIDKHGLYTVPQVRKWAQTQFVEVQRIHARASAAVYILYEKRTNPLDSTGLPRALTRENR
jgi:hypothetical protein